MYGDIIILQENFALYYMPHNCTKDYPGYILRDQFSCLMGAQSGMKVSCGDTERTEHSQRTRLFYYPRETARNLKVIMIL